jgi:hypothetical protein
MFPTEGGPLSGVQMTAERVYDVALSFAGEDRSVVRELAERLRAARYKVFFDEYERAALWGEDLTVKLQDVYQRLSRFCVLFISRAYAEKSWTIHERRAALSRALSERIAYILPIRLDDTNLPGFPDVVGYLDLRSISVAEVFGLLSSKLGSPAGSAGKEAAVTVDKVREVLAACYRRAVFSRMHAQINWDAMFASLAECRATLQRLVAFVEPTELQCLVASIIGELDFIERRGKSKGELHRSGEFQIDGAKLRIIATLLKLRDAAGVSFVLPTSVTEEVFFTSEDASKEPSSFVSPDPWMRFRTAERGDIEVD